MERLTKYFVGIFIFFLNSIFPSFSQTTIDFNSYTVNETFPGLSHVEGDLKFEVILGPDGVCTNCIGVDSNEGKDGTPGLDDANFIEFGIVAWKISKADNSPFQFLSLWIQERGLGSTSGTIKAFKGGSQVGSTVDIDFNSNSVGLKSFSSNPDFYDVDYVYLEAADFYVIMDEITYDDPFTVGDSDPAEVTGINLVGSPLSTATSVTYQVDFSKNASNISIDDFTLTTTGTATGTISAVSSGTGTSVTVTVNGISGEGTIRLDLLAGTDIESDTNVTGTAAFTSGQIHNVSPCLVEDFEDETDGSNSFSYGGFTFSITGNMEVHTETPPIGINGSSKVLINTGSGPYSISSGVEFNFKNFSVYLSSDANGTTPTDDGSITVVGKNGGSQVYSVTKASGFPTDFSSNSGYFIFDLKTEGGTDNSVKSVDEIEISIGGSFQYINIDNFEFCADNVAPSGYTVNIDQDPITQDNDDAVSFTFAGAEIGTTYEYTFTSSGGGTPVTGSGTILTATDQITGIDLSGLGVGTITLSVNLTDASDNEGLPATDNVLKKINNAPVATPPTISGVQEDVIYDIPDDIQVADSDGDDQTLTINVTGGTVTLGTTGVTFGGSGNGSASFTASGTLSDINAALDAATFVSDLNLNGTGAGTIAFSSNDGSVDSNTASVTFDIEAVNDDPTFSGLPASVTITEDVNPSFLSNALSGGTFEDIDAGSNTVTLFLEVDNGYFEFANPAPFSITIIGNGTGNAAFSGTVADIEIYLNTNTNVSYNPPLNLNGTNAAMVTLSANDGGYTGTGGGTNVPLGSFNININAVNDDPTFTGLPTDISVQDGVASNIDLSSATFGDVDSGSGDVNLSFLVSGGTLSATSTADVTVSFPIPGAMNLTGTAAAIEAFLNTPSNIQYTNAPGSTGDNAATLSLSASDNGNTGTGGGIGVSFGSINIDVDPLISISTNDVSVAEGDAGSSTLQFTVSLDNPAPAGGATVDFSTSDGTASAGSDYTAANGTLSFVAGETSKTIDISINGDTELEGSETFTLTLSNPTGTGVILDDATGTGLIFNDDFKKASRIYWANNSSIQSAKLDGSDIQTVLTGNYTGVRIDNINQKIYFHLNGGNIFKADLDGSNVETIISGAQASGIALDLANNKIYWSQFNLDKIRRANLDGTNVEDVVASTNDPTGVFVDNFNGKLYWGKYNSDVFSRSNLDGSNIEDVISGLNQPWAVHVDALNSKMYFTDRAQLRRADLNGSNIESLSSTGGPQGLDLDLEAGKVYYGGSGIRTASLDGVGDMEIIPSASSGTVWGIALSTEDPDVLVSVDDPSVAEGNSGSTTLTFTVSLDNPAPAGGATVDYATSDGTATAGSDYTAASGTLNFAEGETSKTVDISVVGDETVELDETLTLTLSNPTGTNVILSDDTGIGTILNDDQASVTIADVSVNESDGNATISVTLDNAVQGGFTVDASTADGIATTADSDYSSVITTLTFTGTAGEVQTFQVPITDDSKVEIDETVSISMSNLAGTTLNVDISDAATLTIINDDFAIVTIADVSGNEDDGAITITASLDNAVVGGFTVNVSSLDGTAIAGVDYTSVLTSLIFAGTAGETQAFTLTPTSDAVVEANETVLISMSGLVPSIVSPGSIDITDGTVVTILNDDVDAPSTPDLAASSDSGISDSDNITNDLTPTFTGSALPNSTVSVISDLDGVLGTTMVDGSGNWTFTAAGDVTTGIHLITAIATDLANNDSPPSGGLSVTFDNTAPVPIVIGGIGVQLDNNGITPSLSPSDFLAVAISDDYSAPSNIVLSLDKASFDCSNVGNNSVTITATDEAGNSDFAVSKVFVQDVINPTILAKPSITLNVEAFGTVDLTVGMVDEGSFDNCDILTQVLSKTTFDRNDEGVNNITYTVTDVNGNPSQVIIAVTIVVVPKVLNIVVDPGQSKTYGEADPVFTFTATGFEGGDDETILTGSLGRAAGMDVGTYAITIGTLDAGPNYAINFSPADFEITPATLDITADAGQSKVYGDADPVFTYQVSGYQNGDDATILSGALARASGEAVGTYAINLGSLSAEPNYTINYTGADFAITPATLTITADAGQSKVYGDADPIFTYQASGFKLTDTDAVITGSLTRAAGEDVGSYAIQPGTIAAGPNYTINFTSADFEITPATLTVTTDPGQTKVYGNGEPVFSYQAAGFKNGDSNTVLTGALARAAGEDVGTYGINLGSLSAGPNYTINFTGADFTITPRTLNITANANQAKVYGSADPVFAYTASNFGNGDNTSILTGALSRVAGEDVGMYAITIGSLDAGMNYVINFTSADFEIAEKVLNVTADAGQGKVFGTADPTLTYQVTGFENGDDASILTGALARAAGENVGSYAINLGSLDAGMNYAINYTGANFTITKATITGISFADGTFEYDGTEKSLAITGTLPAGTSVAYSNNGRTDVGSQEVTATITGSNFNTLELTADLTITPAEIGSITFNDASFEYDGTEKSLAITGTLPAGTAVAYTNNGRTDVGSQEVTATITGSNYTTLVLTADLTIIPAEIGAILFADGTFEYDGTEKSLAITGTLPAGTAVAYTNNGRTDVGSQEVTATITGSNYTTLELTADLTITAKEITVTADSGLSKIAGEADPILTYTAEGLADGEGMEVFAGSLSRAAGEDVGLYAITQGTLSAGDNYTITFIGADFEIIDGDTDGDGVPDQQEEEDGTDPTDPTDFKDTDGDGVPDYVEEEQGTDPADPEDYQDTDGDQVPDYVEVQQGTDPSDPDDAQDTDEDGVPDYIQERSISELVTQSIQVAWNTPEASLNLPTEVLAITGLGEMVNVPVTWDLTGYDPLISGMTAYAGTISTIPGIFNTGNLTAELSIEVLSKPAPTDVTLSENEFIGIPDEYFQEIGYFTVVDPTDDQHTLSLPEGLGDNELFEVIDGILFWSSVEQRAGETQFEVVLQVEDRGGNVIQKTFLITRLRTPLSDLEVVNTFTPNADGVNDTWGVPALRYYSGSRIQVFDRGGRRLFYTEDPDVKWDGTFEGEEMGVGAYYWVIEVEETGEIRRGVLNLLRQ